MELPEKLKRKLREVPDQPGCYLMRDRSGRIIYVGKAVSLRKRVQSYFRDASLRRGSPKLRSLVHSIHDLEWVVVRNEAEALLMEGRLIKEYRPRYNVSFRDDKRFLLLKAYPEEPFPRFQCARLQKEDGALYFGPYVSSASARAALDFVEKRFGLRKCTPHRPDAETYRHCLNDIIRYCSAPCVGRIEAVEYAARFKEACAFLRGERPQLLESLREQMQQAAARLEFENATVLRDTLLHVQRAVRNRVRVSKPARLAQEDIRRGLREIQQALGLSSPPNVIEAFDISNISGTLAVASMVTAMDGVPHRSHYRRFRIRTVAGSDDPAMMAEAVHRRYRRLLEENGRLPGLILIDGGLTQLRAARRALAEVGAADLPAAGLAKRFEELHWDEKTTIRFERDSPALMILQRLRDEAHRFALTYHRHLRHRRIQDSILDEVDGVGEKRKRLLLQHFGSVRRLLAAVPEDLCAVPGIGLPGARRILAELRALTGAGRE